MEKHSVAVRIAQPRLQWWILSLLLAIVSGGLVLYSQTIAFVWDEGFHLVAAQLIAWGKTPYVDFAFPQTLLNAYFNAAILYFASGSWRAVHVFDALFVAATMWLAATYVMRRFPDSRWRLACAVLTGAFIGLDSIVIAFGAVAQAYGSGMLLTFAAYCVALCIPGRRRLALIFLTGLLAGAAAGATLLTAPVIPVLLVWILLEDRTARRFAPLLAYCAGVVIAFTPEILLFIRAPQQTWFNVVQYQALFRRVNWGDVGARDFDTLTDWATSAHSILLGLFALIGLFFLVKRCTWERRVKNEFYLAAALAIALGAYIATAHPTFSRYFIFLFPFVAIVASAGFYYTAARLFHPERPFWPSVLIVLILCVGAAKYLFDDRDATHWSSYEAMAQKIHAVTPAGAEYFADEMVYFLLRQTPPSGMEFSYSHKLELPPAEEKLYHMISLKKLKEQVAHGRFATFETCKDDIENDFQLDTYYPNQQDFDDCTVYWRK